MATMDDVARAANVSTSTVSHVINGTRKVHADTLRKVKDAVQALGYIPNSLARSLARSATSTIGVAIPAFMNHYFGETVQAIEAECSKHGLMMLFTDTHDDPTQELKVIKSLHQRRVDGILFAPCLDPQSHALNYLKINNIPTVLVDRFHGSDFDQVGVENKLATAELINHLLDHGHRRIAFVSGMPDISTSEERLEGYRLAMQKAGIVVDPSWIQCGFSSIEPARRATATLLALDPRPTAIMAANNMMTIGAMHALRDSQIDVPKNMALVGFDDFDWADFFTPRLTVLAQPLEEQGKQAVKLLIKRIKTPAGKRQTVRLRPTLQVRNSCGCV